MINKTAILVRVSSKGQDYNRQIQDLTKIAKVKNWDVVDIITEKISGAADSNKRDGVKQLIAGAKSGRYNKIMISEISRLGRNTIDTLNILNELNQLKVSVYVHDLNIETLDKDGKVNFQAEMLCHMLALYSKRERENLIFRIKSGLEYARQNGSILGRPVGSNEDSEKFLKKHKDVINTLRLGLSIRKTAKLHEVSTTTVQKIKKAMILELENAA